MLHFIREDTGDPQMTKIYIDRKTCTANEVKTVHELYIDVSIFNKKPIMTHTNKT